MDCEELAYRRGFVHGVSGAGDAVRAGMTADGIDEWCDRCQRWRIAGAEGNGDEYCPPRAIANYSNTRRVIRKNFSFDFGPGRAVVCEQWGHGSRQAVNIHIQGGIPVEAIECRRLASFLLDAAEYLDRKREQMKGL